MESGGCVYPTSYHLFRLNVVTVYCAWTNAVLIFTLRSELLHLSNCMLYNYYYYYYYLKKIRSFQLGITSIVNQLAPAAKWALFSDSFQLDTCSTCVTLYKTGPKTRQLLNAKLSFLFRKE